MSAVIEAYVTNLGRYNEGFLDGEYLKLPATTEEVQALLKRIHVDGRQYEEIFITDYDTNLAGMQNLGEYESIDELNYLATLISDMDDGELEKFEAAAVYGDNSGGVKDLINLAQNLDCYDFLPDIADNDDLGRYLIEEMGFEEVPERLTNYIDFEAYGRDFAINESGEFVDGGYIWRGYGSMTEYYDGREIPEEYRIFSYPTPEKQLIRETLKEMQKLVDGATVMPHARTTAREER